MPLSKEVKHENFDDGIRAFPGWFLPVFLTPCRFAFHQASSQAFRIGQYILLPLEIKKKIDKGFSLC
jgi:hypothetical protein